MKQNNLGTLFNIKPLKWTHFEKNHKKHDYISCWTPLNSVYTITYYGSEEKYEAEFHSGSSKQVISSGTLNEVKSICLSHWIDLISKCLNAIV